MPGGMMTYGIPDYRLPMIVLLREIQISSTSALSCTGVALGRGLHRR